MAVKKSSAKKTSGKKLAKQNLDWAALSSDQKNEVWRRMFATYRRCVKFAAGKYNVVGNGKMTKLRERAVIEEKGEDDALTQVLRNQFLNLARNGVRNNETLNAILHQFKINVIGTVGGKAYFDFGPENVEIAKTLKRRFRKFCRSCEFYDGMKFRDMLEIVLQTICIGGDMVIAFDNCTFENSGKLIGYEPDCVANMSDAEFTKRFGRGETQRNGRIYNGSSRFMGVIVSSSERGRSTFDNIKGLHVFEKDPNCDVMDVDWFMIGNRWRLNQGRGTPPITSPLGSFLDVDVLQRFEIEAAKNAAQMCAQVYQTSNDDADADPTPSPDLAATIFDEDTAAAVDAAAEEAAADALAAEPPPSFKELESAGILWNLMPAGAKMELLQPNHPNTNMNEFIRIVAGRGGWACGVAHVFTNGQVSSSYAGYRGEQMLTWPTFERWQKKLEDFCDWTFRRWFAWASKFDNEIRELAPMIDEDMLESIKWTWPIMREVNAVDAQNAWNMGLKNGTVRYADILGPEWKEKLRAAGEERQFCREIDFPHPADETVSGQLIGEVAGKEEKTDEQQ